MDIWMKYHQMSWISVKFSMVEFRFEVQLEMQYSYLTEPQVFDKVASSN